MINDQNWGSASERIFSGSCNPQSDLFPHVAIREFASAHCGSTGMSTGTATFVPGAQIPYHKHSSSEVVTILIGEAVFVVENRAYRLSALDCINVPAGITHRSANQSSDSSLVVHWTNATACPSREFVNIELPIEDRGRKNPLPGAPESIVRFTDAPKYELAEGTRFCDLFAGRFGTKGICGGYGEFEPGSFLPCHIHDFDESISIIRGEATCQVMGKQYRLSGCDTAFVPRQRPHRFLNESQELMAMLWVYSGDEPERAIVDTGYCDGALRWTSVKSSIG